MKRRILATFLSLCLLVGLLPTAALAVNEPQEEPAVQSVPSVDNTSGSTTELLSGDGTKSNPWDISAEGEGNNVTAYLEQNNEDEENPTYTLIISGSGAMKDWESGFGVYPKDAPWATSSYLSRITHVVVEDGVTYIGDFTFGNLSSMETLSLGKDVASFGIGPFAGKRSLMTITVDPENTALKVIDGALLSADGTTLYACTNDKESYCVPDGVTTIYRCAFSGNDNLKTIDLNQVTNIDTYAFLDAGLTEVYVPATVTTMGSGVFRAPNIESVEFYGTNLATQTFYGCTQLKKITIGSTVQTIGMNVFNVCSSIETVYYDAANATGSKLLQNATATGVTLTIGPNVQSIYNDFLNDTTTMVDELIIEEGQPFSIGARAFKGCSNITELNDTYDRIVSIGSEAFMNSGLTGTLILGNGVETIGLTSFKGTSITKLIIEGSESGVSIKGGGANTNGAFANLSTLTTVVGRNIKEVGWGAFYGCSNLVAIDLSGSPSLDQPTTTYYQNPFKGIAGNSVIYLNNGENVLTNYHYDTSKTSIAYTNGGTFAPSTNFESGKLATPIKDGSKFDGWYTDSSCSDGNKVTEGTDISNNTTYYAKWTEVSDYDIAEGDENITLTMIYGDTLASTTVGVTVPTGGSISTVESSNDAIKAEPIDTTVTIKAKDNLNAGTYTGTVYVYTSDGSTHWINVSLTVNKADSTVNPDEDSVHITATYGETITLTAEVAKAQTNGTALMAAQDEVEFFCGSTSLGAARVRYSDGSHTSGVATLIYDTSNGGIPVGTTSTITAVYGGSVNLNGSNTNSIQVTLNKINTSIDITPDRTSLTGGGTVTLTVDKSGLPDGAEVNVTCNNGITPSKNADGTWAATLPNSTEDYTFTASYTGDENHNASSDTCTVSVTRRSSGGGGGGGSTTYTVSTDAGRNGDVTVSPSRASYGDTVTITVEPDEGYELDELIVTDSDGDEIDVERVSATRYTFEMPRSRVTVEATFVEITEEPDLPTFTDVSEDAYYADAVLWAVANGVTYGTSATTFSPDMAVSRAQMVTFLWRAHGSPKATGANPFTDVSTSDYYYDAVLWAVANGVTNGTSATTFSPDMAVTRAQAVTFQWRAAGSPVVSGSSFGDVATDAYYVNAVTWAVTNGITNGTGGNTFSPDVVVSRAQAVTFLHRELG